MMNQMETCHILASADRQLVLHELLERGETVCIEEISRQVAARRHKISPEKVSDAEVERAHVRLVHGHLPKLQERDIIDVDWDKKELSLIDGEDMDQLFEVAEELESWPPDDLPKYLSESN